MWPYGRQPTPLPWLHNSSGGNPQMPQNPPVYHPGGNPQNSTGYNPGGNPQMPPNPAVYNPGGYPQMPQNFPLFNLGGYPQVPQNLTVYNRGGYPQMMPLPLLQNPYSARGVPEMFLPLPRNSLEYNPGGNPQMQLHNPTFYNPEVQNQQMMNYVSFAPYSDHARQQERRVPMTQDQMAGDPNWLFQNRYRPHLDFQNGEVVMVRSNQQKWLYGQVQRMSMQGVRIWIADADILVNVPLVLVPTHVLKMPPMQPELPPPEPVWTMSFTDERKSLVQGVSHRQLFHKFGCMECAICGMRVSGINVVSPWNCSHQVHDYCLQLRMQHTSTPVCPSCEPPSSSNEHPQQWLHLQCACGFRGSVDSACIGNMNPYVFCPNCHRPVNVNRSEDLPRAYSEPEKESLQRESAPEQLNTVQSFSSFSRLEAIQEGTREGGSSTPPSPEKMQASPNFPSSLLHELLTALPPAQVTKGISSARSSLQDGLKIVLSPPQVTQAITSPRGSFVPIAPKFPPQLAKSTVHISFQDEVMTAPSPPQSARNPLEEATLAAPFPPPPVPLKQKGKSGPRISFQDEVMPALSPPQRGNPVEKSCARSPLPTAPSPPPVTLKQKGKSGPRISFQDDALPAPSPPQVTERKSIDRSSMEGGLFTAPSSTQDSLQDEASSSQSNLIHQDDASPSDAQARAEQFHILTIPEAEESSERVLDAETPSLSAPHRQNIFRYTGDEGWLPGDFDEEASSPNDFAPPVYINHFENFLKLGMASEAAAKEILANAAASETEVLPPPPADFFCSRPPALVLEPIAGEGALFSRAAEEALAEGAIDVTPAHALFSRAAGMITEAPAWATTTTKVKDPTNGSGPSGEAAAPAWITVIKDGVDSRKEDPQQREMDRLARKKEAEFQ